MKASVVVINHNAGPALVDCLRSVADGASEIVLVDNASEDGSTELAIDTVPGARVIRNGTNIGFAAAANQGGRASTIDPFILLNPDAVASPGAVDALARAMAEHPRAGVVGGLVRNPDGSVQPTKRAFPKLWQAALHGLVGVVWPNNPGTRAYTLADASFTQPRGVDWVAMTAVAIRREAFDAVGGFDEGFFFFVEDVDFCRRLADAGWEVWFEPRAEFMHIWGGSWTQRPIKFLAMHQRNLYRYFRKHKRGAWVLAAPFVAAGLILRFTLLALRWLITGRSVPKHRSVAGARTKGAT
jgi:GT2 family glycosyltransferase